MAAQCRNCGDKGIFHSYLSGAILVYYMQCEKCLSSTKHVMSRHANEARKEVEGYWNNGFIR